jgi:3-phenylpropionate/trans-cinnamate dioxygenase ferredoxin reductase subunit
VSTRTAVIAGAGLAGANAAVALRENGFEGQIFLIGEEPDPPYDRPPLSKEYLRGEQEFKAIRNRGDAGYAGIEMMLGTRVLGVDSIERTVEAPAGHRLRYDVLLLATGGRNRRPPIPGINLEGVMQLRTRRESDAIREAARTAKRVAVVGLGFIGTEVGASLRMLGLEVVGIGPDALPLARILGSEFGGALAGLHRDNGVELCLGERVEAFDGKRHVTAVRTSSGRTVDCDLAIVGLGVEPAIELAAGGGIATLPAGIVTDSAGRTSVPAVFAAGDNTVREHPLFGPLHIEHWNHADRAGTVAGAVMAGRPVELNDIPSFWSDQFGVHIEYIGHHRSADRTVVVGSLESREFMCFYVADGTVKAVSAMGYGDDIVPPVERLIRKADPADVSRLGEVALEELAR